MMVYASVTSVLFLCCNYYSSFGSLSILTTREIQAEKVFSILRTQRRISSSQTK